MDWMLRLKAKFMNCLYRVVTNRSMKGCKFCRALVIYQYQRRTPLNIPKVDNYDIKREISRSNH